MNSHTMSCTASGEGLVPGLAWAEGVAEADETGISDGRLEGGLQTTGNMDCAGYAASFGI